MKNLSIIGELTQHPDISDWKVSKPIAIPFFSGQALQFIITDASSEPELPQDVEDSIANFLALNEVNRINISEKVYKNYLDFVEAVDIEDLPISDPTEIWKFVFPAHIYISRRSRRDSDIYIKVACGCEWEEEHGLQLVFRLGNKLVRVSGRDGHLTHADAYDLPEDKEDN